MAVGKGSMERAAKAARKAKTTQKSGAAPSMSKERASAPKKKAKALAAVTEEKKLPDTATEVSLSEKEAAGQIVYEKSRGILERAAEPGEIFEVGDDMPVYYF